MALFEVTAYDKKVYEEELRDFLPDKILDVHTHVRLSSNNPPPLFLIYRQNLCHKKTIYKQFLKFFTIT